MEHVSPNKATQPSELGKYLMYGGKNTVENPFHIMKAKRRNPVSRTSVFDERPGSDWFTLIWGARWLTPRVRTYHKAVYHESRGLLKQPFDVLLDRSSKKYIKKNSLTQNPSPRGRVPPDKALIWRASRVFGGGGERLAALVSVAKPEHA